MKLEELFEGLNHALYEARKNPALNIKKGVFEQLYDIIDSHPNKDNICISFTDEMKLGIDPMSNDGQTPLGIYFYPLIKSMHFYKVTDDSSIRNFGYGVRKPYIQVFQITTTANILNVDSYSMADFISDYEKLKIITNNKSKIPSVAELKKDIGSSNPAKMIYMLCQIMANVWSPDDYVPTIIRHNKYTNKSTRTNPSQTARNWNHIFRALGYDGMIDYGNGIIYPYATQEEPDENMQGVVFHTSCIKSIDTIYNKYTLKHQNVKRPPIKKEFLVDTKYKYKSKDTHGWYSAQQLITYIVNEIKRSNPKIHISTRELPLLDNYAITDIMHLLNTAGYSYDENMFKQRMQKNDENRIDWENHNYKRPAKNTL